VCELAAQRMGILDQNRRIHLVHEYTYSEGDQR